MKFEERVVEVTQRGWPEEYAELWWKKYYKHKVMASYRGMKSHLTFGQYLDKVVEAGIKIPEQIARGDGNFVLARIGDTGPYTVESCRFILNEENRAEAIANGRYDKVWKIVGAMRKGQTKETSAIYAKVVRTKAGRTAENHEGIARQAAKLSREFCVMAPDGIIHHGSNLKKFCRERGLNSSNMYQLLLGNRQQVKGWKAVS